MTSILPVMWFVIFFGGVNPVTLNMTTSEDMVMRQGYFGGGVLYYVPFGASDRRIASQFNYFAKTAHEPPVVGVDYVPALRCMLDRDVLGNVYLFSSSSESAVFSSEPGMTDYTPLWRVNFVAWNPGKVKRPLISADQVIEARDLGDVTIINPGIVLDASIVIPTSRIPIRAITELNYKEKEIELMVFRVQYVNRMTLAREVRYVVMPDVSDPFVAARLGANHAPRLTNGRTCSGGIYAFLNQYCPPSQYPIISQVAEPRGLYDDVNRNSYYTPVLLWSLFNRGLLPRSTVVTNQPYMDFLLSRHIISSVTMTPAVVSNSPVVDIEEGYVRQGG